MSIPIRKDDYKKLVQETALYCREPVTFEQADAIFQSLISIIMENYEKNLPTYIPFIGDLKITYINNKIIKDGLSGKIKINIEPDIFLEKETCIVENGKDEQLQTINNQVSKIKKTLEER